MEKKTLIANLIFYCFIIFAVIGMIYVMILLKGSGSECVKNPFVYGAKNSVGIKSNSQNPIEDPQVSCSCTVTSLGSPSSKFCFNSTEVNDCSVEYPFDFGE